MKKYPIPAPISYSQQTEDLLRKNVAKSIAQLTEAEIHKLLQDIERSKVELKLQNEELKQAKEQATIAANKYIELYDFAPTGYFALTKNGEITELNHAGARMLGNNRSKFLNKSFGLFVSKESKPIFNHFLEKVFSSNVNEPCKATLSTDGNPLMYLQLNGIHSQTEELCFVTAVNITESMLAEEKFLVEQAFRNSIESALFSGIAIVDDEGCQTYVNPYFCKLFGFSAEELTGKTTPFVYWPADQLQAIGEAFQLTLANKAPTKGFELEFMRKDGIRIPVNVIISPFNDGRKRIGWLANVVDITERKHAEEALRAANSYNRRLIEASIDPLVTIGSDGKISDVNSSTEQVTGFSRTELIGTDFADYFTEPEKAKSGYQQVFANGSVHDYPLEIMNRNGNITPVLFNATIYKDENGISTGVFAAARDITERIQAEKAIQTERRNLQSVFESSPVPLLVIDKTTNITMVNQAAIKFCGGTASEILQHRPGNALHCVHSSKDPRGCGFADDCKLCIVRNSIERLIAEGGSLDAADIELELYRNGKSRKVWMTVGVEPLLINGKDHWCIAMSDITERKEFELALKLSKKMLSETELIGKVGGWEFNIDTMEQTWTDEIYNIHEVDFNFNPNVENGINFYTAESRPLVELAVQKVIELQESFDLELEIITAKGNLKSVHVIGKADLDYRRVYGFFQDITDRKLADQLIKQKNEELQRLNAAKDKFFSIIAHDLRSPFNGILGFSNILVDQIQEKNFESIEEYALLVQKSAQRAFSLLLNLLEWSRSQTGMVKFSPQYVEIGIMIRDVVNLFVDIAHQKRVELSIELPSKVIAFGDKDMLNTILRNLVSNAIKFSHPGGTVIISAVVQPTELTISVCDTGVGISKARIDKLFQIDQSKSTIGTQNEQGTGLGLILCKEFVEKHLGKIWVESEVENLPAGKTGGSTIYFTIPLPANLKTENRIPQKN